MNTRNKLRLIVPCFIFSMLILNTYNGLNSGWNEWTSLAFIGFIPLFFFYTSRFLFQYKQVEKEGSSKSFEDSTF